LAVACAGHAAGFDQGTAERQRRRFKQLRANGASYTFSSLAIVFDALVDQPARMTPREVRAR
jgi:hypothetical protein